MNEDVKPPRRWVPVLLVVSLGLNLLVAGVIIGTALRFHGVRDDVPPGFGPALYRALPDPERKALRRDLADKHRRGAEKRSRDFKALGKALRAIPFDRDEVQNLLEEQARANDEIQAALQEQWLARVSAMSDEERKAYADRLEDVLKRRPDPKKRKD